MTTPETRSTRVPADGRLAQLEGLVTGALLVLSLAIVLLQVLVRSVFGHPLSWTDEAARLCLVWLTFIGAGFLMARGRHLAVDALDRRLPRKGRAALDVLANLVVVAACALILVPGAGFVATVARSSSPALQISTAWFYGPALIGLSLVVLHAVVNSVRTITRGEPIDADVEQQFLDDELLTEQDTTGGAQNPPHDDVQQSGRHGRHEQGGEAPK